VKRPDTPSNEVERLAELRAYDILDTANDPAFDVLTQLAADLLGVPIALVSLIDAKRQWFKSHYGLDATETPRDLSFCGHVVARDAPLVVPDALADARFADNPLVSGDPHVRFYAGMPLRTPKGFVLGTLCAIDHAPREPTPEQLTRMALLAQAVVAQLEAHRERRQLARERRTAEEAAARLEVLFVAMAEGVVVQDQSGVILEANPASERILGLTRDQIAGRSSLDPRWHAIREDGTPFPGDQHPAMLTLRTGQSCKNVVMGVHKPDGELTWISINALPLTAEGEARPRAAITTFHDITQIKLAQLAADRLARKERLVTTGTLAAGVGHEINNPLSFILANIDFSLEELRAIAGGSPSGRLQELIEVLVETREGAERIRKIVRGLRALAREESEPTPTDIEGAIDISINMAGHELRHKATVSKELGTTPPALADESRLSQVLVNLLVNAAQAFPTGDVERNIIRVTSSVEPDGRVAIAVSDNGPGIPEALRRRVFDPFFTTKEPGEGTGLGLSICQSIVTALGGELLLQSEAGVGTTFRVLLPGAPLSMMSRAAEPASIVPLRLGRVLIIDDEPAILGTVRRILEKDYEVVALSDARVALRRLEAGETYDVVFCDVMMPHLTGEAVYERVRAKNSSLAERFVFITGGADETETQNFLTNVPNERIEKPFSVQNLRGIVRRYTDRPKD
jgi:PAS domain S-box-containing protein